MLGQVHIGHLYRMGKGQPLRRGTGCTPQGLTLVVSSGLCCWCCCPGCHPKGPCCLRQCHCWRLGGCRPQRHPTGRRPLGVDGGCGGWQLPGPAAAWRPCTGRTVRRSGGRCGGGRGRRPMGRRPAVRPRRRRGTCYHGCGALALLYGTQQDFVVQEIARVGLSGRTSRQDHPWP